MPANETKRSRTAVLALLLVVLAAVLAFSWWPAASPASAPSNQARDQRRPVATTAANPAQLDVRLEDLKQASPEPAGEERNPFRFYVKPPPPPPRIPKAGDPDYVKPPPPPRIPQPGDPDYVPPPPPPPPPIPLKFIGTMEAGNKKVAIFTDGRGLPQSAPEGGIVLGQYKVVRIGIESVVMEYLDGKGRQTIPMRGGS